MCSPLELVSSAVRRVSQHLVWRGSVAFELPDLREPSDEETLSHRRRSVRPITGELLFRLPGRVVGIRTAQRREWEQALPVVVNRLPKSVWHVSMPRTLGGRIGQMSIRRRLDKYSSIMPAWASRSMATEHERVRFDVAAYARLRHAYVDRSSGPFSCGPLEKPPWTIRLSSFCSIELSRSTTPSHYCGSISLPALTDCSRGSSDSTLASF